MTSIIIPTISIMSDEDYKKILYRYYKNNIYTIRVNMTRYIPEKYILEINKMRKIYSEIDSTKKLQILLDIPYPGCKSRIIFDGVESTVDLYKDEIITIVDNKLNIDIEKRIIYVDSESDVFNATIGEQIYMDDGKSALVVLSNKNKILTLKMINNGHLKYLKSIYRSNNIFFNESNPDKIDSIFNAIATINPEGLILSFLETEHQLIEIKNKLSHTSNSSIKIIPKIETPKGVKNLKDIFNHCNTIMLGRGDLGLVDNVHKVAKYQNEAFCVCNELEKEIYIATDILNSVMTNEVINRAEILDIYYMLKNNVHGIVSSGPVGISEKLNDFVDIINKVSNDFI